MSVNHEAHKVLYEQAKERVEFTVLKSGLKGVAIGEEHLFLAVGYNGKGWRLRLADLHGSFDWVTGWCTIKDIEDLRLSRKAKALRDYLKEYHYKDYHLEQVLGVIQDHENEWLEGGNVEKTLEQPSPEVKEKALQLLRDPDLILRLMGAFRRLGLVGETKNALTTHLTEISAKLPDPENLRSSGRSGLGKTTIVVKTLPLLPPEMVIIRSGLTKKALYYLPEAEIVDENTRRVVLKGKVLIILEESESQEFLNEAKPLLSHDVPTLKYSFVDEKVTRTVILEGAPAYIGITTVPQRAEEHLRRAILSSPDRGEKKYTAVIQDDAERQAFPWLINMPDLEVWREAIRQLQPVKVWNPWLPLIAKHFPKKRARCMGDWKKFRTYIEAVTLLHQYQRERVCLADQEYIVSTPFDVEVAIKIVEGAMMETIMGLERDVRDFYEDMREENINDTWTYKSMQQFYEKRFGEPIGRTTLKDRYVDKLVELGLLDLDDTKKTHTFFVSTKNLTDLTDLNNTFSAIFSDENKAKIKEKIISYRKGVNPHLLCDVIDKTSAYRLSSRENVEKLLKTTKDEEYPEKPFFSESVESVGFSQKPSTSQMPKRWNLPEKGRSVERSEEALPPSETPKSIDEMFNSTPLDFDALNFRDGPHQLPGEMFHDGECYRCKQTTQITGYYSDFKGNKQDLCTECLWAVSKELEKRQRGEEQDPIDKAFPKLKKWGATTGAKTSKQELEQILRRKWQRETTEAFYKLIHENSSLDRTQAAELLAELIEQGKMTYDSEGLLIWVEEKAKE